MKRTIQQQAESRFKGDYTGGYDFYPWLWYMKKVKMFMAIAMVAIFVFLRLSLRIKGFVADYYFQSGISWFALLAALVIAFMTIREYKHLRKGVSD